MSRLVVLDLDDPDTLRQLGEAIGPHITSGPAPAPTPGVMTTKEVAAYLGVSEKWVRDTVPQHQTISGTAGARYSRHIVEDFAADRTANPTSQETP